MPEDLMRTNCFFGIVSHVIEHLLRCNIIYFGSLPFSLFLPVKGSNYLLHFILLNMVNDNLSNHESSQNCFNLNSFTSMRDVFNVSKTIVTESFVLGLKSIDNSLQTVEVDVVCVVLSRYLKSCLEVIENSVIGLH